MRGQFIINPGTEKEIIVPNTIVAEGAEAYLATLFNSTALTGFYVGLCNQVPDNADVLADITTEPGATGGYARQALARNSTDWPTIATVDEETSVKSKVVSFAASGADFDTAITRMFLASVASGAGTLYSYSAALASAVTVLDGDSFDVQYEMFLR